MDIKFNDLTDEQKARAMACKSAEELVALARAEGVELSEEQLDSIAGGDSFWCPTATSCPNYEVMR
jgi:ketopantoate reductase